jgi:hypothetical protein
MSGRSPTATGSVGAGSTDVQIAERELLEFADCDRECRRGIAVGNVVKRVGRGEPHTDAIAGPYADQRFGHLDQETRAVDRAPP